MSYVRQFSVDHEKHPKTIAYIDRWKKQGLNLSDKICSIIDREAEAEERQQLQQQQQQQQPKPISA
jgi:hypothetical protein